MANRPKSVYLTERTMSALRPDDSLSARLNQIVDRYLEMVARDRSAVRRKFSIEEWAVMIQKATAERDRPLAAVAYRDLLARVLRESQRLINAGSAGAASQTILALTGGEVMVLVELLENDRWGDPPGTHT